MLHLTRTARSACDAPPIMLGTKLLCPGASRMVKCFFSVSKYALPTSTVFPLSLSSWFVSRAQDRYLEQAGASKKYQTKSAGGCRSFMEDKNTAVVSQRAHHVSLFFSFASLSYFSSVRLSTIPVKYLMTKNRRPCE